MFLKKKKFFSHDAQRWQIVLFNKNKDILNAALCIVFEF